MFFVYARVARLALVGALRVRALVHTSAWRVRVLVHASSLSWGGGGGGVGAQWAQREYLRKARRERGGSAQRPGSGMERARRLGELGGAETLRAWRARGVQGTYSVRACHQK